MAQSKNKISSPPRTRLGLLSLYDACLKIYPNASQGYQVTSLTNYWKGGSNPLDYILIYRNPGKPANNIAAHWHYISFGLSDLYGDGRVHKISGNDTPSGYGIELSFRLKREPDEHELPMWPVYIMQDLAKMVFKSGNSFSDGDFVPWHCPLDKSESRIQHMLMVEDPQLGTVQTPHGRVTFVQIVGVCAEELQAAERWNVHSITEPMKFAKEAGGPWFITNMKRSKTVFDLDSSIEDIEDEGIECPWQEKKLPALNLQTNIAKFSKPVLKKRTKKPYQFNSRPTSSKKDVYVQVEPCTTELHTTKQPSKKNE